MPRNKTDAEAIAHNEKVRKAIEMRVSGATIEEVAAALGWNTHQAASKAIRNALKKATIENAAEYRTLQLLRVEKGFAKVIEKMSNGNLLAVDRFVKLSKRASEITGSDMPVKIAQTDKDGNDVPRAVVTLYIPENGREIAPVESKKK